MVVQSVPYRNIGVFNSLMKREEEKRRKKINNLHAIIRMCLESIEQIALLEYLVSSNQLKSRLSFVCH